MSADTLPGKASEDLVILVVDITDFEGTFGSRLAAQCGSRLMIVANKADLLPARCGRQESLDWLRQRVDEAHVTSCGIHLVSATQGAGIAAMWAAVREQVGEKGTVRVVGARGVGKTTLVQSLPQTASRPRSRRRRWYSKRSCKSAPKDSGTIVAHPSAANDHEKRGASTDDTSSPRRARKPAGRRNAHTT